MADTKGKRIHIAVVAEDVGRGSDMELIAYHRAINHVMAELDERNRRLSAGILTRQRGFGGIEQAAEITGMSWVIIRRGLRESKRAQALS